MGLSHPSEVEQIIFDESVHQRLGCSRTCLSADVMSLSLCPAGEAAAPQNQEEAPAAPPLVGEDAELVEQLRKVCTSLCC